MLANALMKLFFMAGAEGLEVASQPLLRCPKFAFGLERRRILTATPSSPRFIRHRRRFGDDARHAPRASCSFYLFDKKQNGHLAVTVLFFMAGAEGLEPSARGFGDRCSTN